MRFGNLQSELSQELTRFRSYSQKDLLQTPLDKEFAQTTSSSNNFQITPVATDKSIVRDKQRSFLSEDLSSKFNLNKKVVSDLIPVSKVHEFRDAIIETKDEEFNNLPTK